MKFPISKFALILTIAIAYTQVGFTQEKENQDRDATSTLPLVTEVQSTEMERWHMGIFSGVTDPIEEGYDAANLTALEVGYQPIIPFGASLEYLHESYNHDDKEDLVRDQLMFKASYHFGGETPVIRYSYAGLGLGIAEEKIGNRTNSYLATMPNLGFDIPIGEQEKFSLGANLRYTATSSNEADNYSINGVVKYWF